MLVPDPNFRSDPSRAVYVQGTIDQQLIDRLTPQIIALQSRGRGPITVYIDSLGGSTLAVEVLLQLLWASNQDADPPCRLITFVTSRAGSAAADLLSSGDYAIAYASSTILYHGVRTQFENPLTVELASYVTESLKESNDKYALELARRAISRSLFRYVSLKDQFDQYRARQAKAVEDLGCFIGLISERLSERATQVVRQAGARYQRYEDLHRRLVQKNVFRKVIQKGNPRFAEFESAMLKGIIDFEMATNRDKNFTFLEGGLSQLTDDFLLLRQYIRHHRNEQVRQLCDRWGKFFLTDQENVELAAMSVESQDEKRLDKVLPRFLPLWLFFVALCHSLQEGENQLTAVDAFWLGLVDEVVGAPDLPCIRHVVEFRPTDPGTSPGDTSPAR